MHFDPESILSSLGPARRFADPGAPAGARRMAARGALPLPPPQIAAVLFALTHDPAPEVRDQASRSLSELPDAVLDAALEAPLHPAVLAHFAQRFREDPARLEKIVLNPATPDETFCFLVGLPFPRIIEIAASNQTRLLRCPALVEALGRNPVTGQAAIERILEFLGAGQEKPTGDSGGTGEPPLPEASAEVPELPAVLVEPGPREPLDDGPDRAGERSRSLPALIQEMKVIEKVKLARFGNKEARTLLLRDRNRIVATAAVRSPKITENEVLAAAQSRSVSDDVLRVIAGSREWTRIYRIQQALAANPKTPLAPAIKFLNYLTDRDLRAIMRSRDVPRAVVQHARRILARKGKV